MQKSGAPVLLLEKSNLFTRQPISLSKSLTMEGSPGIIAEFKRRSPSGGIINDRSEPQQVCRDYALAGSSAVSVLTDFRYFGGQASDLSGVRTAVGCPVLRKDFIIDEYQIIEARSIGADAVLLITELHPVSRLEKLFRFASSLGLEVLVEVHERKNISKIPYDSLIIGINSRDLSSLNVNTDHAAQLISMLPGNVIKVAESGIRSVSDCKKLADSGFDAFLIGEYFMRSEDPGKKCREFIAGLRGITGPTFNN